MCFLCLASKGLQQAVRNSVDVSWSVVLVLLYLLPGYCYITVRASENFQMRVYGAIPDPQVFIDLRPNPRANNSRAGSAWRELAISF